MLRWVKVRAARQGKGDSEVIEESLRRDLGLDLVTGDQDLLGVKGLPVRSPRAFLAKLERL